MEWKKVKLGDYIDDIAAGPFGSNLKVECFVEEGFPIIDGANLRGFTVTDNVTKFVTEEKARSLHRAIATRGEVIVTISGNVGQIAYIPNDSRYNEYLVSQRQFRVRFKDTIDVPYLVYYMHSREGQHKILSFANQTGVPALAQPLKNFRNIELPLPPIETQRRIAAILSSLDDKIENNNRINTNLEAQAKALFKSWFVDFEPFGGVLPEDWEETTIGEICKCYLGGTPSRAKAEYWNGEIPWINSGEVNKYRILEGSEYITELGLQKSATKLLPRKTTVLAITGATLGQVSLLEIEACANQSVIGIVQNEKVPYEFIYPLILNDIEQIMLHQTGGAQQHINKDNVESHKLILPTDEVMAKYKAIQAPLFETIANNCFESQRLAALRDTLLPKLMKGEIEV